MSERYINLKVNFRDGRITAKLLPSPDNSSMIGRSESRTVLLPVPVLLLALYSWLTLPVLALGSSILELTSGPSIVPWLVMGILVLLGCSCSTQGSTGGRILWERNERGNEEEKKNWKTSDGWWMLLPAYQWKTWRTRNKATNYSRRRKWQQKNRRCIHSSLLPSMHPCIYQRIHSSMHPYIRLSDHSSIHESIEVSIYLSIRASIHPSVHQFMHLSIHASTNASIHPCIHPHVYPTIHRSLNPCIYLSIHPSIHTSIHPFIHPSIHSSLRASIHPSVHPFMHPSSRS